MQSAEIELKFPVSDPAALQRRLPQLGFHLDTPRTFEHNTLYDTAGRDLRTRTQLLRIRQYGDLCTLTHKRMPDQASGESRYKVRIETETAVADGRALGEIFEQLGYRPVFIYEKFRTEWSCEAECSAHLVIDETPIGDYVELEGPPNWIDRTVQQLGIDPSRCLTDSYGRLFLDWKERHGSAAEHLTFAAVSAPALTGR
jgi:adenylate cyclase class 2